MVVTAMQCMPALGAASIPGIESSITRQSVCRHSQPLGSQQENRRVRFTGQVAWGDQGIEVLADIQLIHQRFHIFRRGGRCHRLLPSPGFETLQPIKHTRQ